MTEFHELASACLLLPRTKVDIHRVAGLWREKGEGINGGKTSLAVLAAWKMTMRVELGAGTDFWEGTGGLD